MQLEGTSRPWADLTFVKGAISIGYILGHSAPVGYTNNIRVFRQRTSERTIRFRRDAEEYAILEYFRATEAHYSIRFITSPTGNTRLQTASLVSESLKQRSAIFAFAGAE